MKKYDLHIHTHFSIDSNLKLQTILKITKRKKLDGVAITDHQEIRGALELKKLNKDENFEVIIGEEVSTNYGDVLLYHVDRKVDNIDFFEVVDEAKKQGALVVIPHPFRKMPMNDHRFMLPFEKIKSKIDAIEVFNARTFPNQNLKSKNIAEKLNIAQTAGSDTHFFFEIGNGRTFFEGDLRGALKRRETKTEGSVLAGPFGAALSFLRKKVM